MNKKLQGFKKRISAQTRRYWAPIVIAFGVMVILNSIQVGAGSIGFVQGVPFGIMNLVIAGVLFFVGWMLLKPIRKKKSALAGVALTTGLSVFFWGTHFVYMWKTGLGIGIGFGLVILGCVLLKVGFNNAPPE
jgi:hypothetical protein